MLHHSLEHWIKKLWFVSANVSKETLADKDKVYQTGTIYGIYRCVIAVFIFTLHYLEDTPVASSFFGLTQGMIANSYALFACIALGGFYVGKFGLRKQLFVGFILDIVLSTLYSIVSPSSSLQIVFVLIVATASSCMLLPLSQAIVIVLLSVIAVIIRHFVYLILDVTSDQPSLKDSLWLSIFLLAVSLVSWSISQRLTKEEISNREKTEEINTLNAINHAVIKIMDIGIIVINKAGYVVLINETAQRLLTLPINDAACATLKDVHDTTNQIIKQHTKLYQWHTGLDTTQDTSFVYHLPTNPTQSTNKLRISSKPLSGHDRLLIVEDIQRELKHAQTMKLASLGQLSASIAHEIRNPLSAISQASELLLEEATADDLNQELYQMIVQQTKRVNGIITDVLSLSRQEIPKQQFINLCTWMDTFVSYHYANDDIQVWHGDCTQPAMVYFDPNHLEQIMVNLVNNALHHTKPQPNLPDVAIQIRPHANGAYIDVLDNGDGVEDKHLSQLFHPFFTTNLKGTGLGLYLSQSFSEANNAKIHYIRSHNTTCFRLTASNQQIACLDDL